MTNATRHKVEHSLLPSAFYANGERLMRMLMDDRGDVVLRCYGIAAKHSSEDSVEYEGDDFSVEFQTRPEKSGSPLIIRIQMPAPAEVGDCRAVYLCFGEQGQKLYFTSELAQTGEFFLCALTGKRMHLTCLASEQDEFDRVAALFEELIYRGALQQLESLCAS